MLRSCPIFREILQNFNFITCVIFVKKSSRNVAGLAQNQNSNSFFEKSVETFGYIKFRLLSNNQSEPK